AVNVALERFGVKQAADEQQVLAEIVERSEDLAEFHIGPFALRPPLFAVKAVAGEQHGQPHRGFTHLTARLGTIAPDIERFQPRKRHRHTQTSQHGAAGKAMRHGSGTPGRSRDPSGTLGPARIAGPPIKELSSAIEPGTPSYRRFY